jgi:phage gpG-like protein
LVVLEVKTLGADAFVRGFNRYAMQVQDWRPAFESIYRSFVEIERRNFRSQGHPTEWRQLSDSYAAWKAKHYPGKKILQRTKQMHRSLTTTVESRQKDTIKEIEKLRAEFGTGLDRAYYHQHGTRNMPARPVVQLTSRNAAFWARIIHEWAYQEAVKA